MGHRSGTPRLLSKHCWRYVALFLCAGPSDLPLGVSRTFTLRKTMLLFMSSVPGASHLPGFQSPVDMEPGH